MLTKLNDNGCNFLTFHNYSDRLIYPTFKCIANIKPKS